MPTVVKRDATREGGRSHRFRAARRRCAARQRSTDLVRCSTVCVRQGGAWPVRRGGRPGRASRGRTSIRASIRTAVATPPVGACPAPRAPAGERRIACMRERMRRVTPEHAARAEPEPTRITAPLARRRAPLAAPPAGRSADRLIARRGRRTRDARHARVAHARRAGTPARDGARRPPSLRVAQRAPHAGPDIARCAASSATAPVPHRKTAFGPSADGRPLWTTVSRAFGRLVGRVRRTPFFFGGAHSPRMRRTHGMGTRR
ncbi:Uncharacterised protein [Burkholderia pseudomallei]|nr:hypothetical protein BG24_4908 [Burkholderia pseudomallei PB08298010]CAJ3043078.1 Uncharacterised protein [Burkholderia pseudomallei]CAJ5190687.1 Uncharacterised protein [Burkholderia pseudomallei]CAJ7017336.1 Uncharacterised protein [Burkholderia pseudomallei]CFD94451.1 Uncharacterised protein [Burkholderia pseudomallei]